MKAEIGIDRDGHPYLALTPDSWTEATCIDHFKEQLGIVIGPDGCHRVPYREPAKKDPLT